MKKINLEALAKKLNLNLTEKGNLELGSDDQGYWNPPGGGIGFREVSYYLLPSGEFRVVIDDRYGRNQGYFEENGGRITKMDGADLEEATQLAKDHIESLEKSEKSDDLLRAWRIASSQARSTMRKIEAENTEATRSPLEDVSTEELEAELARRKNAQETPQEEPDNEEEMTQGM